MLRYECRITIHRSKTTVHRHLISVYRTQIIAGII